MINPNQMMQIVDGWRNIHTRCPGTLNGTKLKLIAYQKGARFWNRHKIKNYIYKLQNSREVWYKKSECHVMAIKMGLSHKRLGLHPKAVPMEEYVKHFLDGINPQWLERNNYELI